MYVGEGRTGRQKHPRKVEELVKMYRQRKSRSSGDKIKGFSGKEGNVSEEVDG